MPGLLRSRGYLLAEIVTLTLLLPLLLGTVIPLGFLLPALWVTCLYCFAVLRVTGAAPRPLWQAAALNRRHLAPLLVRFALITLGLGMTAALLRPDLLFGFVRARPAFWAIVMILYPILSAIPQELIFRSFFFARYRSLFGTEAATIAVSAVAFAITHFIFQNWVAPLLTLAGGFMFARTYAATRSLALVSLEHALYGCMIFTLGLGSYFYHGAVGTH